LATAQTTLNTINTEVQELIVNVGKIPT
jgi:hypothetical protein